MTASGTAPTISVVMPVHNGERFIREAINSILSQSWADFEFVIGDDGSTDGTTAIIAEIALKDPRIRGVSREEKSGLANAANWVVGEARGDVIALIHADDISYADRLQREMAIIAGSPDVVLVGAPADGLDARGRTVHPPNLWRVLHPYVMAPFAHSSIMFRRSAFIAAGGYRASADYWEDLDLYWRIAKQGRVMVLPRAVTGYRYSGDSVRSRDKSDGVERAVQRMYEKADVIAKTGADSIVAEAPPPVAKKLRPRVFIARAWVDVWNGRRTEMLPRMLRSAQLGPNWETIEALGFLTWATISPRTLRAALRTIVSLVNARIRRRLDGQEAIEWKPF